MEFKLPQLPYSKDALTGFLSPESFEFHYEKHHKTYIDNLNKFIAAGTAKGTTLEDIMMNSSGPVFNNAAQTWNHTFYWFSLAPESKKGTPDGALTDAINKKYSSVDGMFTKLAEVGTGVFGSGWVWLVQTSTGELDIVGTSNAEIPMKQGLKPLLTFDVWEHAYYIDYRNRRADFLKTATKHTNWNFVNENFKSSKSANLTPFMS